MSSHCAHMNPKRKMIVHIWLLATINTRIKYQNNEITAVYKKVIAEKATEKCPHRYRKKRCLKTIFCSKYHKHKDIHKYTREDKSRGKRAIIDYVYVLAERRCREEIEGGEKEPEIEATIINW